jgi:hypothetical protein
LTGTLLRLREPEFLAHFWLTKGCERLVVRVCGERWDVAGLGLQAV